LNDGEKPHEPDEVDQRVGKLRYVVAGAEMLILLKLGRACVGWDLSGGGVGVWLIAFARCGAR
jgi:hypothetical protein